MRGKRKKYRRGDSGMLIKVIVLSLLVHLLMIALFPSSFIFSPPPQYVEVDLLEPESGVAREREDEETEEIALGLPEPVEPLADARIEASERERVLPELPRELLKFVVERARKPEAAAPEFAPRPAPTRPEMPPEKRLPDALTPPTGVSLIDDALTSAPQPYVEQARDVALAHAPDAAEIARPRADVAQLRTEERLAPPIMRATVAPHRLVPDLPSRGQPPERPQTPEIALARLPETKAAPIVDDETELPADALPRSPALAAEQADMPAEEPLPTPLARISSAPSTSFAVPTAAKAEQPAPESLPPRLSAPVAPENQPILPERIATRVAPSERQEAAFAPTLPPQARDLPQETTQEAASEESAPPQLPRGLPPMPRAAVFSPPPARTAQAIRPLPIHPRVEQAFAPRDLPAPVLAEERPPIKETAEPEEPAPPEATESPKPEEAVRIEGPAARRRLAQKPAKLPTVKLDRDVTILLKFWVLPDGTVGDVVPLQRGDVRLEQAAISYVKGFRFTASSGKDAEWGIVSVKYRLR